MAWEDPRVWSDGAFLTAAQMNQVSGNLRETAPGKAGAEGDFFYVVTQNQISTIPIGPSGSLLTARPSQEPPIKWEALPTPLTTQGDLLVGNEDGEADRLPAGEKGQVLTTGGTGLEWDWPIHHWSDLFPDRPWYPEDESADRTVDNNTGSLVTVRDIIINGNVELNSARMIFWVGRRLVVNANATVKVRTRVRFDRDDSTIYPFGSASYARVAHYSGASTALCGVGGGVTNPASATGSFADYEDEILNDNFRGGGGTGFPYRSGGAIPTLDVEGAPGGGMLFVVVNEIVLNGSSLTIDARGDDGVPVALNAEDTGGSGGGGGCVAVVSPNGSFPTIVVTGGNGGHTRNSNFGFPGRVGGNGTAYAGRELPWS